MYLYSIFSVSIQNVILRSFYGQILDLLFSRLTFVNILFMTTKSLGTCKLLLIVSTGKMFSFMNWCRIYIQMSLSCCLLPTLITSVIYSHVNRLFMITKSLVIWKLLLTVSTRKMFSFMSWWHMYLQTYLCCLLIVTFNT